MGRQAWCPWVFSVPVLDLKQGQEKQRQALPSGNLESALGTGVWGLTKCSHKQDPGFLCNPQGGSEGQEGAGKLHCGQV